MGRILLRGIIGIAPIAVTLLLVVWIYNELEYIFGSPIEKFFPHFYFNGIGVIVALIILFFMGLLLNHWVMQRLYNWFEKQLKKIPLLKTIYTAVTDLMSFFHAGQNQEKGRVVQVEINGMKMIGLVTREQFDDLPKGVGESDEVCVFFPFSYQIGGITTVVKKSAVKPLDMTIERGLRFIATGGNPSAGKPAYEPERKTKKAKD